MQTAFVTGSTGLLGNDLVRLLAGRGVRVKALARSREKAAKQIASRPRQERARAALHVPACGGDARRHRRLLSGERHPAHPLSRSRTPRTTGNAGATGCCVPLVGTATWPLVTPMHTNTRSHDHKQASSQLDFPHFRRD